MPRLTAANVELARTIVARYPRPRSALIPLCHVAQQQDGWLSPEAMEHIAELLDLTPAEVLGTASFYEMFKLEPVGKYLVNVCTNIACLLVGGEELLEHCEERLGIKAGATTADGLFTLQVNYRYFTNLDNEATDRLLDDIRAGRKGDEIPPHGTTTRIRQQISPDRWAGGGAEGLPEEFR
jgi:NADH-quinone oxidoreductase subunit E